MKRDQNSKCFISGWSKKEMKTNKRDRDCVHNACNVSRPSKTWSRYQRILVEPVWKLAWADTDLNPQTRIQRYRYRLAVSKNREEGSPVPTSHWSVQAKKSEFVLRMYFPHKHAFSQFKHWAEIGSIRTVKKNKLYHTSMIQVPFFHDSAVRQQDSGNKQWFSYSLHCTERGWRERES